MTFKEFTERLLAIGTDISVYSNSEDGPVGVTIYGVYPVEETWVPSDATNILDISHECPWKGSKDQESQISSAIETYLATPLDQRGLNN